MRKNLVFATLVMICGLIILSLGLPNKSGTEPAQSRGFSSLKQFEEMLQQQILNDQARLQSSARNQESSCDSISVECVEDIGSACGNANAQACFHCNTCTVSVPSSMCSTLNVPSNPPGGWPPGQVDIPAPSNPSLYSAYCLIRHEIEHSEGCGQPKCLQEAHAYGETSRCLSELWTRDCIQSNDPNSLACQNSWLNQCLGSIGVNFHACRASNGTDCSCEGCEASCIDEASNCMSRMAEMGLMSTEFLNEGLEFAKNQCQAQNCIYCGSAGATSCPTPTPASTATPVATVPPPLTPSPTPKPGRCEPTSSPVGGGALRICVDEMQFQDETVMFD